MQTQSGWIAMSIKAEMVIAVKMCSFGGLYDQI
jgi:hypothetical protein